MRWRLGWSAATLVAGVCVNPSSLLLVGLAACGTRGPEVDVDPDTDLVSAPCVQHTYEELCALLLSGSPCTGPECFVTVECVQFTSLDTSQEFVCDQDAIRTRSRGAYEDACTAWGGHWLSVDYDQDFDAGCVSAGAREICELPTCP